MPSHHFSDSHVVLPFISPAAKPKLEIHDRLQNKALVSIPPNLYAELGIQPLSHRRRVAGLTVFKKIQCSLLPHPLDSLKLPLQTARRSTRQSCTQCPNTVIIPKSRTSQHQRSFIPSCARLWNSLPASVVVAQSAQSFKSRIHNMLMNMHPAHKHIMKAKKRKEKASKKDSARVETSGR